MSAAATQVALAAAALASIAVAAMAIPGVARVFLVAQVVQWSLSYVARPAVLLWVTPRPRYGDDLADPRLASIGYDRAIALVMEPVVFGLGFYALLVIAYAVWRRAGSERNAQVLRDADFMPTMWAAYCLGIVGRLAAVATGNTSVAGELQSPNVALYFMSSLGTVGCLAVIIYFRSPKRLTTTIVIGALLAGELLWSATSQSKTPIMAAVLAIAVRFAMTGWNRLKTASIAMIFGLGIAGFDWLQSFKQSPAQRSLFSLVNANYPSNIAPFMSILRRFDLFVAATDGYYMDGRPWLTPIQVIQHIVQSFIPAQLLGQDKYISGVKWANEVRGSSLDMRNVSVALAEGNIPEGFVLGGYLGVAVAGVVLFSLVLLFSRLLYARSIFLVSLSLAVVANPVLFERGILGTAEQVGKFLQVAVLLWFIYLCVAEFRRRKRADVHHTLGVGLQRQKVER